MPSLKITNRSTFAFNSDIARNKRDSHKSGILHATKRNNGGGAVAFREEHAFAWIDDKCHENVERVVDHLAQFGFDGSRMVFIPYSSYEKWRYRYPHGCPYMECNADGKIKGIHIDNETGTQISRPKKRKMRGSSNNNTNKGSGPTLIPSAALSDVERTQLHIEVFNYFSWLHSQLTRVEKSRHDRIKVSNEGISVPGIRDLMTQMEITFRHVGELKKKTTGGDEEVENDKNGGSHVDNEGDEKEENDARSPSPLPLLEKCMGEDLALVIEETQQNENNSHGPRDFEFMYQHLLAYKEREGHLQVPYRYVWADGTRDRVPLGGWVGDLRRSRRNLRSHGFESEPPETVDIALSKGRIGLTLSSLSGRVPGRITAIDPASALLGKVEVGDRLATVDGVRVTKLEDLERGKDKAFRVFGIAKNTSSNELNCAYLSAERVARLDAIGFKWEVRKTAKSWDEWLALLKRYQETHGKWPAPKERWESIGEWVHFQRRKYAEKDEKFMAERFPKLDEIGFPWATGGSHGKTRWEDHFRQLVEFKMRNRHLNVPCPEGNGEDDPEVANSLRFYRWVKKLYPAYRAYQNGKETTLNEDRIKKLLDLGFEFDVVSNAKANTNLHALFEVPFERRLDQLKKCKEELGHLQIDYRYNKMNNLGGWALEISKQYKDWQEGNKELSPLEEDHFNQLSALGFEFNVFAQPRSKRSWEENFDAFLEFRTKNGHSYVPPKYKGDVRLGKWADTQRDEYKLQCEGKPSRLSSGTYMTKEKFDKLQNAGFVWKPENSQRVWPE